MVIAILLGSLLFGYLLGSIPFGLVLTRAAGLGDVRKIGSGNIGATNVLRTGAKGLAAATLLLDALKGTAAVRLALLALPWLVELQIEQATRMLALVFAVPLVAGLGAFLGHVFPVWLGFQGGKGVATYIGVLIGYHWPAAVLFCLVWLAIAAITRLSSLSSLAATAVVLCYFALAREPYELGVIVLISLLIVLKHRANIRRLMAGEEPRIGASN